MFQYSFTERTVPVPVSVPGKRFGGSGSAFGSCKTGPTVPVRFLGHPVSLKGITIRTSWITPHHFIFQEFISVIISPPITPNKFWRFNSEKVFASQERVSGFPEKGADLRGSRETSGEVRGTSGEVWETSGEPLDCC